MTARCPQVVLAMKRGRREGRLLHYAAARTALWLLNDLPARLETLLFPDNKQACTQLLGSMASPAMSPSRLRGSPWLSKTIPLHLNRWQRSENSLSICLWWSVLSKA